MLNTAILMGRLTADPELKKTPAGVSITTFVVAVNRSYVPKGQERQADFIDVVAWRSTAEFITKYFRKGQMIAVQGSIQTRNWQDKQGNKRKAVEIVADKMEFCGDCDTRTERTRNGFDAHAERTRDGSDSDVGRIQGDPDVDAEYTHGATDDFSLVNDQQDLPF